MKIGKWDISISKKDVFDAGAIAKVVKNLTPGQELNLMVRGKEKKPIAELDIKMGTDGNVAVFVRLIDKYEAMSPGDKVIIDDLRKLVG